jgi:S1-C subfamily serine protease
MARFGLICGAVAMGLVGAAAWAQGGRVFFGIVPSAEAAAGAPIAQVGPGGTAAAIGLQAGDVIVALNGHPVDSTQTLVGLIGALHPGDSVKIRVKRGQQTVELAGTAVAAGPDAMSPVIRRVPGGAN